MPVSIHVPIVKENISERKISICSKCLGFSFLPTFKNKQTSYPNNSPPVWSKKIFWIYQNPSGHEIPNRDNLHLVLVPWILPGSLLLTPMGHPGHSCGSQSYLLLHLQAQQAAVEHPSLAPATAALVAAREVNAGLATLWDAGDGQAWCWESIFEGQKLIELFL